MNYKRFLPVFIGATIGFAYYYFIGCRTGTCPITGNPYISTIYGAVAGFIFAIPSKKKNETKSKNENDNQRN